MTALYKLTDADGYTQRGMPGETLWQIGVPITATGIDPKLCSNGVVHAYHDPIVGLFMNPIHTNFRNPRLWEAEGKVVADDGIEVGTRTLTLVRELTVPEITVEQRVRFAILCVKDLPELPPKWTLWADKWLSGEDRTGQSAAVAAVAARAVEAERAATWAVGKIDLAIIARKALEDRK